MSHYPLSFPILIPLKPFLQQSLFSYHIFLLCLTNLIELDFPAQIWLGGDFIVQKHLTSGWTTKKVTGPISWN